MGCRNACICGGRCSDSCYEPERYCGEAEDLYDELHGSKQQEEEYYKTMEEQYYRDMEEQSIKDSSQNMEEELNNGLNGNKG